jgi:hypothetical protein
VDKTGNAYRILVGITILYRQLGRSRRRLEYNIEIGLREIELGVMDLIDMAQYRDQ